MAEKSWPYDTGTTAVNEAEWQKMAREWLATGVITGRLNQLAVSADGSALSVSVASGRASVEGFHYENDAAKAVPLAAANATNPRIDTIVARLDRVANTVIVDKVTGTAAAAPVAPALSQTDSLYELPLANVTVPAAAGVIVAANVSDRRAFVKNLTEAAATAAYVVRAESLAAVVTATESTTSTTFVDLATVGPAVAATVGSSGRALVILSAEITNNTAGGIGIMAFAVSGATTVAADANNQRLRVDSPTANAASGVSAAYVVTGLTAGSNTFTSKYRAGAGTASFLRRSITVIPL